ncbi:MULTISPECIES: response regulator transcription factor [Nosocomiicoccus]|uniref:Response regulator ArlR n=1 Tax=Nosocomiicoccus massiliensis TaxID=1232430 RepID=A0AAF0YJ55_9STAP|nr:MULTISPECIES: response regulator transcription factor [Nosocomiicoccus]MDK6862733.1 response regulator transcription factor [Nosocomiicoccus ampullae]OFL46162.1 DNA-binding response regulator [Nosocomiicoccus sp. HMSC067E10]OFO55406.1 DNA-binding response regulator [Nosocomiicoccus sp. HMSC059G07]OFS64282.1 DNA-binding response regulator [Nosocomiicoccus sp. HMSC09A07]WOS96573.1 response regulator transcription factor [Nosocomiicoccus massiliensis]
MPNILVVEDEQNLARFLELELTYEGYDVEVTFDGLSGLEHALDKDYDCILLDLMLPELNGLEVCRKIRKEKDTPIIMITAKDTTYEKVIGLDYGADDYIVKPFEIEELLARIRVIMRRRKVHESNILESNGITIDLSAYKVLVNETELDLTKTEFELLRLLIENENIVLKRETILDQIWGYDNEVETNVVDVYIRYLRNKLKQYDLDKIIETVRGVGYVIRE